MNTDAELNVLIRGPKMKLKHPFRF